MNLCKDLSHLILDQFHRNGISYDSAMTLDRLVARFFEINIRQIHPCLRHVHMSSQTHDSLGALARQVKSDSSAHEAWVTVFRLRQLLAEGANVNAFLSKNILHASGWDGLLWHYGMHHFHLGRETDKDGFIKRSDHLLFAIIAPRDAYFVDIRRHPPKRGAEWASQDLLRIVHSNWPKLIESNELKGILGGGNPSDREMSELRRKNLNYAVNIDGRTYAPILWGLAGDGSSVMCTIQASMLLKDLRYHEKVLRMEEIRDALARDMQARGFHPGPAMEFELVFLENLGSTPEMLNVLTADNCISRDLCRRGLVVVDKKTGIPIVIHDKALKNTVQPISDQSVMSVPKP